MTTTTEMTTADVLASMFSENTGRHMLDSGGAYGRNWERNQNVDFEARPAFTMTADTYGIDVTIDAYHFLKETVEFDPELDALWEEFYTLPENEDTHPMGLCEEFPTWLRENHEDWIEENCDSMGEPNTYTVNTYNGEDSLSQVLQYTMFSFGWGDAIYGGMVLLSVHGGCDVRGGYTYPRAFRYDLDSTPCLLDNARFTIYSNREDDDENQATLPGVENIGMNSVSWSMSSDGYYCDDASSDVWPSPVEILDLNKFQLVEVDTADDIETGQISILDGKPHCPYFGTPLMVSYY